MDFLNGFIFDIDGTLLDSNDAHARSLQLALADAGYPSDFIEIRRLIGMGLDQILPRLTRLSSESEVGREIAELKNYYFDQEFGTVNVFHHAKELISALFARGYKITVASSASGQDLKKFIDRIGIAPYLISAASADQATSKPAPDLIESALAQLDLPPDEVFMVGDTPYDITAAMRAGVRTLALRCGGWSDDELKEAAAIFDHPADLLDKIRTAWRPGTTIAI